MIKFTEERAWREKRGEELIIFFVNFTINGDIQLKCSGKNKKEERITDSNFNIKTKE